LVLRYKNQILNRYFYSERTTILTTSGNKSIRENFVNIFGAKQLPQVMAIDFQLNVESERLMMVDATERDDNSQ